MSVKQLLLAPPSGIVAAHVSFMWLFSIVNFSLLASQPEGFPALLGTPSYFRLTTSHFSDFPAVSHLSQQYTTEL